MTMFVKAFFHQVFLSGNLLIGLFLSEIRYETTETGFSLGSSLLFSMMTWVVQGSVTDSANIIHHPIAFSGWIGLLVTSLNLLPVGRLDGGHVAYAVIGPKQRIVARTVLIIIVILGSTGWMGWFVRAVILIFMRMDHPPVIYDWILLDPKRKSDFFMTFCSYGSFGMNNHNRI